MTLTSFFHPSTLYSMRRRDSPLLGVYVLPTCLTTKDIEGLSRSQRKTKLSRITTNSPSGESTPIRLRNHDLPDRTEYLTKIGLGPFIVPSLDLAVRPEREELTVCLPPPTFSSKGSQKTVGRV